MIRLASVIEQFESDFLKTYQGKILPSQLKALQALKICRTEHSPMMKVRCSDCDHQVLVPHSCGHRHCPHCQHHESQQWIERQVQKQVPSQYFMITFTLPKEFRPLAWQHQKEVYNLLFQCSWETLQTFSLTDTKSRLSRRKAQRNTGGDFGLAYSLKSAQLPPAYTYGDASCGHR